MFRDLRRFCWIIAVILITSEHSLAEGWNQFRGRDGSGLAVPNKPLPVDFSPDSESLVWKIAVGKGHSSPVIHGKQVFITTIRNKKLLTMAIDIENGNIEWQREAPYEKLESIHRIGSYATSSCATDGAVVVSFFGSSGLFCYDLSGQPLWHRRMGPFNNQFGTASSPLLVNDRIVLVEDHDTGSFLAVFDKQSGKEIRRVERPNFRRNYCSPVVWNVDGRKQIIVTGSAQVVGYDLETGNLDWYVRGVSRVVSSTPVVGSDNVLYVANTGGSQTQQAGFDDVLANSDRNKNGLLEQSELPNSPIKGFFGQFDRDGNGTLDRNEYESIREIFSNSRTVAMAIKPGGKGDITKTHVAWTQTKSIPRNSTPIFFQDHLYMVKDGGILTSVDTKTGKIVKQGRLSGRGKYYSSPVIGDGRLFILSENGHLCVITAEPDWKEVAQADFQASVYASPALCDGRVYIRTVEHLYCFHDK